MNELLFKNSRTRHFPMKNYEYLGLRLDEQVIVFVLVFYDEVFGPLALGHTFVIFSSAYLLECGLAYVLMLGQRNNEY